MLLLGLLGTGWAGMSCRRRVGGVGREDGRKGRRSEGARGKGHVSAAGASRSSHLSSVPVVAVVALVAWQAGMVTDNLFRPHLASYLSGRAGI